MSEQPEPTISETCRCGASFSYPATLGLEPAWLWRDAHRHELPERYPGGTGGSSTQIGFTNRQPEMLYENER